MNNFERYITLHKSSCISPNIPQVDAWVVIPCYNEPQLLNTIQNLYNCNRHLYSIGILVVVNAGEAAPDEAVLQNLHTLEELHQFNNTNTDNTFHLIVQHLPHIRKKHTGPGIARKWGMDAAITHHYMHNQTQGLVLSLDADCTVSDNYFTEIITYFRKHPQTSGVSIYYEHPLHGNEYPSEIYNAIALYEIYLRYYVAALAQTDYPYSFHTIGSAFAVTAQTYVNQGGMNRKNAGEDFYFLQKIIPLGHFSTINTTTVYPSPRISSRVVFGTGPAVKRIVEDGIVLTYPLELFNELKSITQNTDQLYSCPLQLCPPCLEQFLEQQELHTHLLRIRKQSSNRHHFRAHFFQYFNGFMIVKFLNHGINGFYKPSNVLHEVVKLHPHLQGETPFEILHQLRLISRSS